MVYVTANPWFERLHDEINASVHAHISVEPDAGVGRTSYPGTVSDVARRAAETYPHKRLLIHYMQPHKPFLGTWGRQRFKDVSDLVRTVRVNNATQAEVVKAYRENLRLVLSEVDNLLADLRGRTIVSADHGELLGERQSPLPARRYGHVTGMYVPELVEIPWLIHDSDERREIYSERPSPIKESSNVEEQLKELGYL